MKAITTLSSPSSICTNIHLSLSASRACVNLSTILVRLSSSWGFGFFFNFLSTYPSNILVFFLSCLPLLPKVVKSFFFFFSPNQSLRKISLFSQARLPCQLISWHPRTICCCTFRISFLRNVQTSRTFLPFRMVLEINKYCHLGT